MRHFHLWLMVPIAALLVLTGCSPAAQLAPTVALPPPTVAPVPTIVPAPTADPTPYVAPSELARQIDAAFNEQVAQRQFSGAVLIVHRGEMLLRKGYGYADLAHQIPITPATVFRIGALTKPLTAAAILRLVAQGKLQVEDPLCPYLDDCPAAWAPITIHHLLSSTSGIPNHVVRDKTARATPLELVAPTYDLPLAFAPGTGFALSQTDYMLLGMVIERVSGQPYAVFMREQIFEPLGMPMTGYADAPPGLAVGYRGQAPADAMHPSVGYAAFGLFSTLDDLYRFDQALIDGAVLPAAQREQMLTGYSGAEGDVWRYGYGILRSDTYFDQNRMIAFGLSIIDEGPYGVFAGYDGMNYTYIDQDTTVIVLANQEQARFAEHVIEPISWLLVNTP